MTSESKPSNTQSRRKPSSAAFSFFASCAVIVTYAAASQATATEPNDTLATATALELHNFGQTMVAGVTLGDGMHSARDVDTYAFEIAPASTLPVRLSARAAAVEPNLDTHLRLFDARGAELVTNDDGAPGLTDAHITTLLLEPGVYFIAVSASGNAIYDISTADSGMRGSTGTYDLTVMTGPVIHIPSPFEPNDDTSAATRVGSDSFSVTGEFIGDGAHGRRDVDVYELVLSSAARIDVEVLADSIGSTLDPVVRLRTCTDGIPEATFDDSCGLGSNDDRIGGSPDASLSVGVTPPANRVYILVSGSGNRRYNPAEAGTGEIGSVGTYDLHVSVRYFDGMGHDEPNDSIVSSEPIYDGRTQIVSITSTLGDGPFAETRGDRDFFALRIHDDSRFLTATVTANDGSEFVPVLAVYDDNGYLLAYDDNHHHSQTLSLAFPALCAYAFGGDEVATYHVMVIGAGQRPPDDPFVPWPGEQSFEAHRVTNAVGSTGDYRLTVQTVLEDDCGTEPNDTLQNATPTGIVDEGLYVCLNGLLGDSHCPYPEDDADVWSVEVNSVPAFLEVRLCRDDIYDAQVGIFDSTGQRITVQGRSGIASLIFSDPGTYYVAVASDIYSVDPTVACSGQYSDATYGLSIRLEQSTHRSSDRATETNKPRTDVTPLLYASGLDGTLTAIDPSTGAEAARIENPVRQHGGTGGMAYDGSSLFIVGSGRFPRLYHLDATTGELLNDYVLWQGSGWYGDAVTMGGELYLMDFYDRTIHVVDPVEARFLRSMPVQTAAGRPPIGGGLASLAGPNRLYVADAFQTGAIHEVSPSTGAVNATIPAPSIRPAALAGFGDLLLYATDGLTNQAEIITRAGIGVGNLTIPGASRSLASTAFLGSFGDFDDDGDVDLLDYGRFQHCFTGTYRASDLVPACEVCDRNGDGQVDTFDFVSFPDRATGP